MFAIVELKTAVLRFWHSRCFGSSDAAVIRNGPVDPDDPIRIVVYLAPRQTGQRVEIVAAFNKSSTVEKDDGVGRRAPAHGVAASLAETRLPPLKRA